MPYSFLTLVTKSNNTFGVGFLGFGRVVFQWFWVLLVAWFFEMGLFDVLWVGDWLVGFLQAWDVHTNPKVQKQAWLLC